MDIEALQLLLDKVNGCTFATIDSTTYPTPGLKKVTTGTRVLLFTNKKVSGYGELVKRRLIEAGKDPRNFVLNDLPWGERIPDTPLIGHRGNYYLQTIVLKPGQSVGYIGNREVNPADFVSRPRTNQGLPKDDEIIVAAYRLDHIDRIALVGEVLVGSPEGLIPLGSGG
jgi:hypothetical protein